ncbi:MAG: hypothetical protein ACRDQ5_07360 [Sciscionella sp.]
MPIAIPTPLIVGHNDKLAVSLAERNANAALRYIPDWLFNHAKLLHEADNTFSEIYSFLAEKCRETNSEISFTYSDIKNALSEKPKMKVLDTTHLFQYLADRQKNDPNLSFDLDRDDDQKLCRVFFVAPGLERRVRRHQNGHSYATIHEHIKQMIPF